ncbi:MAG: hypothetical protein HND43_02215 [Armatimonadetes bacterium]|nr:hypothetical protein [Armatimonadota bacterium]
MEQESFQPEASVANAKRRADAWIARFAPLVMNQDVASVDEIRGRLRVLRALREESAPLTSNLESTPHPERPEWADTLLMAIEQLDSVERSLRRKLALLAPGDPEGLVDMDALRDRLAERAAHDELGVDADLAQPLSLTERTSPANYGMAAGLLGVSIAWNSFTAVHAYFMIGGFKQVIGWAALGLLGFYALFFGAGISMLAAAFNAASEESIELSGRTLTVRRRLGFWVRKKTHKLAKSAVARIQKVNTMKFTSGRQASMTPSIVLEDEQGREVSFASGVSTTARNRIMKRINAYLRLSCE